MQWHHTVTNVTSLISHWHHLHITNWRIFSFIPPKWQYKQTRKRKKTCLGGKNPAPRKSACRLRNNRMTYQVIVQAHVGKEKVTMSPQQNITYQIQVEYRSTFKYNIFRVCIKKVFESRVYILQRSLRVLTLLFYAMTSHCQWRHITDISMTSLACLLTSCDTWCSTESTGPLTWECLYIYCMMMDCATHNIGSFRE
jgi:hypothetical protein